ncbi:MAG: K+ channel, inward rectifier [Flavobacteriales bacterium]|nr:K+ channel, inward rectifier [Flavobacteriales bacterium]
MAFKKFKNFTNSGFGSNLSNEGYRLITKNGKFNTRKEGLSFFERFDLFHTLTHMHPLPFFLLLFTAFISMNLLFTGLYLAVGLSDLQGATGNNFSDAFFFSVQTITTVGYGGIHPTGTALNLIAGTEAFVGLLSFAVATGLLYGRFSRPKNKLIFSANALISPYGEINGLMARVANPKNSQLINAEAKMIFSQVMDDQGAPTRSFYTLDLELNHIALFVSSWTIVHPINEDSPLSGATVADLKARNAELILLINAYDETYNQPIHVRTSYKPEEILEKVKFTRILGHNEHGQSTISLNKISDYETVE